MITLPLTGYETPPLRSNDRLHWRAEHKIKAKLKDDMVAVAAAIRRQLIIPTPIGGQVVVRIVWTVTDRRRRDVGSSSPTLKVALDAAVKAGLLREDHRGIVVEERCAIEVGTVKGVRVEIGRPWEFDTGGDA